MIDGASVLAVIVARGGSKGVPRKNLLDLGGKPLVAWTVEAACAARTLDRVIVSSDSDEIIEVAVAHGAEAPFVRPAELARDETTGPATVLHALDALDDHFDYVVMLQPTSPFRTAADIDAAVGFCVSAGAPAVVSVTSTHSSPFWTFFVGSDGSMRPAIATGDIIQRRQDLPASYQLNGAVYVARSDWFRASRAFIADGTLAYVMPAERSLDIDTTFDLTIARALVDAMGS